ncbi:MAG: hypothetical protein L6R39_003755 [Caloplaca ligustica]|nr:MAG: hypothetical protein L6R39_003755 [Caloplaca ligustica]
MLITLFYLLPRLLLATIPRSYAVATANPPSTPKIFRPLELPSSLIAQDSNLTDTNVLPSCNGRLYGRNLRYASCMQVNRVMSSTTDFRSFGERGTGNYQGNLPFRYLSRDGLCAIDLSHAPGMDWDTVRPNDLKEAARLVIQICVRGKPNEGGQITGLGTSGGLNLRVVPYIPPNVVCGGPSTGPSWMTCRSLIDRMPANTKRQTFGRADSDTTTVPLPWGYTTTERRCALLLDGREPGPVSEGGDWYQMWLAANAIDFMCVQSGRNGTATGLGKVSRLCDVFSI